MRIAQAAAESVAPQLRGDLKRVAAYLTDELAGVATVYHGLSPNVCFILAPGPAAPSPSTGRVSPEKGLERAVEVLL
jgi:hypothetical protein